MKLRKYRGRIGTLVALGIVAQATAIIFVPKINPNWRLIVLEVTILGSVLGIDIGSRNRLKTTYNILGIMFEEQDNDSSDK